MQQETTQANVAADTINFGVGQPNFAILPTELMYKAATHRLSQRDPSYLNYGFEQGDGFLREALAHFLTPAYGFPVAASQLLLSAGATQAIDMICGNFTQPGDVIFVEEPTFFLNYIRLSFAFYPEPGLVEGARRLGATLDEYAQS